jgi:NAD(P) transhydrogenase subunit alpha
MDGFALITITILAVFLGFEVVSKVSSTLHTPLMSEANAIHGIILLGAIMVAGQAEDTIALALSILAVFLATINVVGGFVVTDRMLLMFTAKRGNTAERGNTAKRGNTAEPPAAASAKTEVGA